ncbi:AraC family transcriptional regulator [Pedobacter sp. Leaf176]|uniref:helix-turn-helix domain-containing protein n=1 Tax=Pedobacter sp. Leaf176 TaxID=1736286 RepID=UPI0007021098|nr:helix-turn-helix domain-containing protein [Pedobacter sp. Leaf176]KQR67697.1 hypothetical protein ASF92_18675 [Pedobacter sp. Leaf176]
MRIFETIKPKDKILKKYISYYYIDIADNEGYFNEYICYPHYNNTISLYKSHVSSFDEGHSLITFSNGCLPLQIFTPIREEILRVTQKGPVYKIGIVFNPFGINQFLRQDIKMNKITSSPSFQFFENDFLRRLFAERNIDYAIDMLEKALSRNFNNIENLYVTRAIELLHQPENELGIDVLAETKIGISRKHLNRLFQKYLGTTPQTYRKILKFRQLMDFKLNAVKENNYGSLSYQLNYADQSHFIKACKQLTNLTPSQFFKEGKVVGSEDIFWNFTR